MSIKKITEAEIAAAAVARLADRPNRGATGKAPLSAEELKNAFDALGRLNAERYNALVESVTDGSFAEALAVGEGSTLKNEIAAVKETALSAKDDTAGIAAEVQLLNDKAESMSTRIAENSDGVGALDTRLSAAEMDVQILNDKAESMSTRISENSDGVGALDTRLSAAEMDVQILNDKADSMSTRITENSDSVGAVSAALSAHTADTALHGAGGSSVRWYTNTEYNALSDRDSRPPLLYHVKMQWDSNPYRVHSGFASAQTNMGVLTELSDNVLRLYTFYIYYDGQVQLGGDTVTMYSITLNNDGTLSVAKEIIVLWGYWVEVLA